MSSRFVATAGMTVALLGAVVSAGSADAAAPAAAPTGGFGYLFVGRGGDHQRYWPVQQYDAGQGRGVRPTLRHLGRSTAPATTTVSLSRTGNRLGPL